ncbi:putative protein OS=Tsukamurella paurometabola (strain ATCC 8368 / DSM / CCUG 35730 /CIP 100753 / JCM 10117 / KCTC 9821 / NBRC 16120 / NCIMB 702349/ NCTC 13040) OX=521096 GN=Tpau_3150 PE=4 SV=1 [Tsukamurella paurometabola]|uniref:Uncharacterized protein n=1 Tax=Tsukamurella paurometabola (strain ATCC 8368 / DSM 20162 / CCUG 35730 / CIP 100753 / JCM 10117 / KCTC 9821 / NBRC 16120 / NCIMB 702349 / NCTC 13040) TaxID=521096 RepID=D5UV19_TSUPD|nr:hypothetical protein [Tsukamurella paurometabola]ADG79737.1 hypothetical protein Tpau_3150 [Tsukamurella paurometabola DSM 20162]SUP36994.1 Uncharacterised protein [Tsukamurella paurometabola]
MGAVWSSIDRGTRLFWRATGRRIEPDGADAWLAAPCSPPGAGGDAWLRPWERSGQVGAGALDDGLLPDIRALDGPDFRSADLAPQVRDFYEHTGAYRMDVWSQWNALFAPGGEAVARLFGRRVEQLALPVQPLAVSRGMTSRVRPITDENGRRNGTAWLRTLAADGSSVYSGYYRIGRVPADPQPQVHVSFPLEEGNIQVFLTPRADRDGALLLYSRGESFGRDGAYVTVRSGGSWYAARLPLREEFRVFVDEHGVLRTDHRLSVRSHPALHLHYRLERTA